MTVDFLTLSRHCRSLLLGMYNRFFRGTEGIVQIVLGYDTRVAVRTKKDNKSYAVLQQRSEVKTYPRMREIRCKGRESAVRLDVIIMWR